MRLNTWTPSQQQQQQQHTAFSCLSSPHILCKPNKATKKRVHSLMVPATGYPRNNVTGSMRARQSMWQRMSAGCTTTTTNSAATCYVCWRSQGGRAAAGSLDLWFCFFFIGTTRWGGNQLLERTKLEEKTCLGRGRWIYWDRRTAVCQKCSY